MKAFFSKRRILLICIDLACISFSSIATLFLMLLFDVLSKNMIQTNIFVHIAMYGLVSIFSMYYLSAYKVIWRYAQLKDYLRCVMGIMLPTLFFSIYFGLSGNNAMSVSYIFSGLMSSVCVCVLRGVYSLMYRRFKSSEKKGSANNVMIIGAGDGGKHICELMQNNRHKYNPVVFVDDDSQKIGRSVNGVTIKGNTNEIPKIVEEMDIKEIVLAIPSITAEDKTRILNICCETLCKVNVLPDITNYIENNRIAEQMKSIRIEDLLGRDVVRLDNKQVNDMIIDKVCMITGGGGSIGSELTRQIAAMKPKKLIVVDIYENNAYDIQQELLYKFGDSLNLSVQIASVRDKDKMDKLFKQFKPELVFHAAAHKHVPLMETNPEEAIKNNVFGTLNIAELAQKYEVEKFVLVSTDKAVNPTNIMGATKRCCEMIIECMAQRKTKTDFVAVRFGNVLGSNGSVIPLFERQIANGGPVTVTDPNIIRFFMTIPEAASLILQAATMARGGEIFVLDMGEPVKILSLAENLIKLHGYRPYADIDIVFTGLRPGEKLYEELLMSEEGLKNTESQKIFIGKQVLVDEKEFFEKLKLLEDAAHLNDKEKIEELLMDIVPTFVRTQVNKPSYVKKAQ